MSKLGTSADELFELCKQVYDATGWTPPRKSERGTWKILYTSDYLLEKLPKFLERETRHGRITGSGESIDMRLQLREVGYEWEADYYHEESYTQEYGNILTTTPLKALLKLTLALNEAGELK